MLVGLGLSFIAASTFFGLYYKLASSPLLAVALYSALFVAPLVYLLAQTVVLLVHFRQAKSAAEQAGDTFHMSTIGNVVGGLFTTLVVMYYFGVGAAVLLDCAIILCAFSLVSNWSTTMQGAVLMAVGLPTFLLNVAAEDALFDHTNAYANYYVLAKDDGSTSLIVNGQDASRTDPGSTGPVSYTHLTLPTNREV